ncbi:MAG: GAF domain-containing sensor histidine kinase [Candidatus Omnitrophica bacterium]|nr:GAF domain-containing sensor histidine kinase [Candidatus Omnitrophota bacterium]
MNKSKVRKKQRAIPPCPKLVSVFDITRGAHSHLESAKCTESVMDRTSAAMGTELGSLMLMDEKKKELFIKNARGLGEDIVKVTRVKLGEGISGWVAKEGKPLLIKDISKNKDFKQYKKKEGKRYHTESLLSVPIKVGGKIIGVINVNNKKTKKTFTRNDLVLLSFIADHVGLAIQNALTHEEVKRMADLKLDFISNISHELKNPLGIIKNSISLVLDGLTGEIESNKRRILDIANRNIDRLNRLLSSLLELAKLEAGKVIVRRKYIDIRKVIDERVEFVRPTAESKGLKVGVHYSMKYSKVWADRDKIAEVIENLLGNALKFTPKGGRITVGASEKDKELFIWVQDTGMGIKKKDLPHLFNKFEQVGPKKSKAEGTGLGLAICKEIVELHKGKIWAESTLHKGTKFNIMLPRDLRKEDRHE